MCGRGRNKPSRGKPHFLIASFPPFSSRGSSPARNGGERDGNGKWARFIVSLFIRSRERAAAPERIASDVGYTYDPIASTPFREFSSFSFDRAARVTPRYCVPFTLWIYEHYFMVLAKILCCVRFSAVLKKSRNEGRERHSHILIYMSKLFIIINYVLI